ncbi:MAG: lamin tail domain-containing protein [Phycisphaerales bacterium]|nr:lamin tail domain-containing protein [Phycisphaerales bacterium]
MKHALCLALLAGLAGAANGQVVISKVYGGGGNSGSVWMQDFIELRNNSATPVDISGWSVQYASSGGTFSAGNSVVFPSGTSIAGWGHILVGMAVGAGGTTPLPTPDFVGTAAMSGSNGKVALVNNGTPAPTCTDASIVDLVGYGSANCSETAPTAALSNTSAAVRNTNGCSDSGNNAADFTIAINNNFQPLNSQSPTFICPGFTDCNNNGISDAIDISSGTSQDCNQDTVPDECQLSGNDCNSNGVLDACELAGNDCNGNGRLDACDIATGLLTDVNVNGISDVCEGAVIAVCDENATVQPAGVRPGANGSANVNIEGVNNGTPTNPPPALASYGGLRWSIASAIAAFDTQFGVGGWEVTSAYLSLTQDNAAFTFDGPVDLHHTNNDAQDFTVPSGTTPNANSTFFNFPTDFADRQLVLQYDFVRGTGGPTGDGDGTREAYLLYSLSGSNNGAQTAIGGELNSASGMLTLVLHPGETAQFPGPDGDPFVAATYSGRTNATWGKPRLVMWAQASGPSCDPDVNQDGNVDQDDVSYLINVVGGGENPTGIDPDFNQDGNVDQDDIAALINTVGGGGCP